MKILSITTTAVVTTALSLPSATTAFGTLVMSPAAKQQQQHRQLQPSFRFSTALGASSVSTATEEETEPSNPRLVGLAFALDDGTRKSHSMAENTAFVQGFFKGISSADSYKNLLTSLYYVYKAMEVDVMDAVSEMIETETETETEPTISDGAKWIQALDVAPLRRMPGLETDMEYFYGPNWKNDISPPSKGTEAYVGRITELVESHNNNNNSDSKTESLLYLFVAHQYTRYLGDLFGGQMMGSMASRSMDLPEDGSGVAFYNFDNVPSTKDFITEWYTTLNDLGVSQAQQQAIVDEANLVFQLNIGILEELEGSPWAALWTMAVKSAQEFTDWTNIKESKNGNGSTTN